MHTPYVSIPNQAEDRQWPVQAANGPPAGGVAMPPEHVSNSGSAGRGPCDEEPRAEILGFPLFDDVEFHLASHPEGLCAMHGYHPAPDWDALLDCGREPADPREHYRWKVTREAFDSIKPFLKEREAHLTRYRRERAYQASVAALARRDPLYERTMEIMDKLMGDLPEVVKELSMPTLAREFGPFLELYKELRHVAVAVESCRGHKRKKARKGEEPRRTLESAGGVAPGRAAVGCGREDPAARERERLELLGRFKSREARDGDLLRYLELMGVGEDRA